MNLRGHRLWQIAIIAVATAALTLPAASAASATTATPTGAATYNGRTIYLSEGWQGAQACGVFSATDVECFDTAAELTAAMLAHVSNIVTPDTDCGAALYLYQNINFGGQELGVESPLGVWINIASLGFGNETSSWWNSMSCDALAAKTTNGSGSQLSMPADQYNSWVGSAWNDSINSVLLD